MKKIGHFDQINHFNDIGEDFLFIDDKRKHDLYDEAFQGGTKTENEAQLLLSFALTTGRPSNQMIINYFSDKNFQRFFF